MKFTATSILLAAAASVAASPAHERATDNNGGPSVVPGGNTQTGPVKGVTPAVTDPEILNFALTLERLESTFYSGAIAKYTNADFESAGYPSWVRGRVAQIAEHEAIHVGYLTAALGSAAAEPCTYSFPYTDPASFLALAQILEGVGTAAYTGAAGFITTPAYLTVAASILSTEAHHSAWISSAVNKGSPWSGSFETPLSFSQVYSLAGSFITSCKGNLSTSIPPVTAFPALTVAPAGAAAGSSVALAYNTTTKSTAPRYLALFSGLNATFVPITNGKVTLPEGLMGTVYGVVSTNGTSVTDASTLAGPAILSFPFSSSASNSQ